MNWKIALALALGAVGVGMAVAGGRKCTVLDSEEKVNRWGKKNESRTPDKIVMVGFWEPSWRDAFCEDPTVETVAIDFNKLVGKQLKILEDQGFEANFPDKNFVVAFKTKPEPQIVLITGAGADVAVTARANVDAFFAGEIEGMPVVAPGGVGDSTETSTTMAELFGRLRA